LRSGLEVGGFIRGNRQVAPGSICRRPRDEVKHSSAKRFQLCHFLVCVMALSEGTGTAHIFIPVHPASPLFDPPGPLTPPPQLAIDAHTVKYSIITTPKMKLKPDAVRVVAADTLLVSPPDTSR